MTAPTQSPKTPVDPELVPLATDIPPPVPPRSNASSSYRTRAARSFGGLLAFLSIWQILSPETRADTVVGALGVTVSVLWFVAVPNALRVVATVGLALAIVALVAS